MRFCGSDGYSDLLAIIVGESDRIVAVHRQGFLQEFGEGGQQHFPRAFLSIDAGQLGDPADPPVTVPRDDCCPWRAIHGFTKSVQKVMGA